ncbi:MAG: hypothetical protein JNN13_10790 [Planctomycetes bacterium]|nr:hypothetical protein [Planctomycetota bacterium]
MTRPQNTILTRLVATATIALATSGALLAQWKTNPIVTWNHDIPARDRCRLELDGCAFVLSGGHGGIYVERTDGKGEPDSSLAIQDPQYPGVLGPWWKQHVMSDCATCKTGPREFFVAYNVLAYQGSLTTTPNAIRVARVFWNPNTDQLDLMPGFPKTLQLGLASKLAIGTSTNAGVVDGAIIAWQVTDKSTGAEHLFQQGVSLTGGLVWSGFPSGVPADATDLGTAGDVAEPPTVVSTDDGEAVVTYHKRQGGLLQHWTAKLAQSSAPSATYRFGPILVPGQQEGLTQRESVTRCCVARDGSGGAVYGFASDWANTQLIASRLTAAGVATTLPLWNSSQGGGPGGHTNRVRALSMVALPNQHALLTYRDLTTASGIRCIEFNASAGLSMGWTRFVRGASIANEEHDDAASALLGNTVCIVSTSDADVLAIAFKTDGTSAWNGNQVWVNDPNNGSIQFGAVAPRWPHVHARTGTTAGFMVAWGDNYDFADTNAYPSAMLAERLSTNGKLGKWFSTGLPGGALTGANTAVAFDLSLLQPMRFEVFEVHFGEPLGTAGTLEVYAALGTSFVGIESNPAAWTLVGSGNVIAAGPGNETSVVLSAPVVLPAGTSALLLRGVGVSLDATPAAPANLVFDAGDFVMQCGAMITNWPFGAVQANRALQGGFAFEVASVPQHPGAVTSYGTGCYAKTDSLYSHFADAAAAASVLSGQSLRFVFAGGDYLAIWGGGTFVAPSGAATPLTGFVPNADDGTVVVMLPSPLPYPGGIASSLHVHSNGNVWFDDNTYTLTPDDYTPSPTVMLAAPGTGFWSWHDFNQSEPGSGAITFESVGNLALVTWMGVESYPNGVQNPTWQQFQFDLSTGDVTIVWPTIDANGTSAFGSGYLVGYSPGGASVDGGNVDLTTLAGTPTGTGMFPLHLTATSPVAGTTMTLTAENVPAAVPGSGLHLGLLVLSTSSMPGPGLDLGFLGAPGCALSVGSLDLTLTMIGTTPTLSLPFVLPAGVSAGTTIYAQVVGLVMAGTLNPAGIVTSNGLQVRIGS